MKRGHDMRGADPDIIDIEEALGQLGHFFNEVSYHIGDEKYGRWKAIRSAGFAVSCLSGSYITLKTNGPGVPIKAFFINVASALKYIEESRATLIEAKEEEGTGGPRWGHVLSCLDSAAQFITGLAERGGYNGYYNRGESGTTGGSISRRLSREEKESHAIKRMLGIGRGNA